MDKFFWILIFRLLTLVKLQSIQSSHDLVNLGDDVSLQCIYPKEINSVAENFMWFLNNRLIESTYGHFEQHNSELLIKNIQPSLTGYYKCQIVLDNGAKLEITRKLIALNDKHSKRSKTLNTLCSLHPSKLCRSKRNKTPKEDGITFTPKPTNKNFELGSSSKIHCKARGSGDLKIYWMRNINETLPNDLEDINGTLLFDGVKLSNKGEYTCYASDGSGSIHQTIEVGIMPRYETSPEENLEIFEGQQMVLDCSAAGSPKPTIKWVYEGKIINAEENDIRIHVFENGSLVIDDSRTDDSGVYACTIGNSAGFKRKESNVVIKSLDLTSSIEENENENSSNISAVFVTCLLSIVYILLVVALMFWCRQRKRNRHSEEMENKNETTNDDLEESNEKKPLNTSEANQDKSFTQNEKSSKINSLLVIESLMISYDKIFETTKLGCGQFGDVLSGNVMDFDLPSFKNKNNDEDDIQAQKKCNVLIRSLTKSADEATFTEFRRQVDLFRKVNCQHVVKVLALSLEVDHHHMVLENSQELKSFLSSSELNEKDLMKFCVQLAIAVESISSLKLTHRDIALRNCTIADSTLKLSMISLSKDKHSKEYFKVRHLLLPIRHMANECIAMDEKIKYTTASDVYSCGITIWEILTHGKMIPFESMSNDEVYQKLNAKSIDYESLLKHDGISSEMKIILQKCFSTEPIERPTPRELKNQLNEQLDKN